MCMFYRRNISSGFSSNFESDASELLENREEILPRYRQQLVNHEQRVNKGLKLYSSIKLHEKITQFKCKTLF